VKGLYTFRFWTEEGCPIFINIDDLLPVRSDGTLFGARSKTNNEFWISLLEKAYFKLKGGYVRGGQMLPALRALCRCDKYDKWDLLKGKENEEKQWNRLLKLHNSNSILTTATVKKERKNDGIITNHAYTITNVIEIEDKELVYTLVKIRNPWGGTEWNGKFSDDSDAWTPSLREKLNVQKKNDGIFYMDSKDFFEVFDYVEMVTPIQ
jgi:hypothetical protein